MPDRFPLDWQPIAPDDLIVLANDPVPNENGDYVAIHKGMIPDGPAPTQPAVMQQVKFTPQDTMYDDFSTLDNCLKAYAACVYRRAYEAGRGENSSVEVLEERMRVEMACLRAVKSFYS